VLAGCHEKPSNDFPRLAFAAAALVLAMAAVRAAEAEPQGDAGVRFRAASSWST